MLTIINSLNESSTSSCQTSSKRLLKSTRNNNLFEEIKIFIRHIIWNLRPSLKRKEEWETYILKSNKAMLYCCCCCCIHAIKLNCIDSCPSNYRRVCCMYMLQPTAVDRKRVKRRRRETSTSREGGGLIWTIVRSSSSDAPTGLTNIYIYKIQLPPHADDDGISLYTYQEFPSLS